MKEQNEEEISLEAAFQKIEEVIEQLEEPKIGLEDSFRLYEEGMKVLKQCNDRIDCVEKKVMEINDSMQTKEFE